MSNKHHRKEVHKPQAPAKTVEVTADPHQVDEEHRRQEARDRAQREYHDKVIRRVTVLSTVIASLAAGFAFWSGYEAHEARIRDERPYIRVEFVGMKDEKVKIMHPQTPEGVYPPDTDATMPTPHIRITGFGKTPATWVQVMTDRDRNATAMMNAERAITMNTGFVYVFPSESYEIHDDAVELNGATNTRYTGVVRYYDLDGRKYLTTFCFFIEARIAAVGTPCSDPNSKL
jgi:hypothetical protein